MAWLCVLPSARFFSVEGGAEAELRSIFLATGGNSIGKHYTLYGGGANGGFQDCAARGVDFYQAREWTCVEMRVL